MIAVTPIIFSVLVKGDYGAAFFQVPILYFGIFFNSLVNFYSGIYIALKRTKQVGYSSVAGAIINAAINVLLIRIIGLYAASISTAVSFFVIAIYRAIDLNKIIEIKYNKKEIEIGMGLFLIWNYSVEVGKDPLGNILRVTNALTGIERSLPQVERRLETLEQQLTQAKEEAKRPFAQEAELTEKSARLAELNSLLNMDEKGSEDALGVDEDAAETEVADRPRQPVNYAGRVAERTADDVRKPSVLTRLHAKQAERTAEPQKSQKRKSHNMEL